MRECFEQHGFTSVHGYTERVQISDPETGAPTPFLLKFEILDPKTDQTRGDAFGAAGNWFSDWFSVLGPF